VNIKRNKKSQEKTKQGAVIPTPKRQSEYQQGYRAGTPDRSVTASSMPILVGAAMIAAAILLSTLVSALGSRYVGLEGPGEESAWLIDRLTGQVYRCEASRRGRASCDGDIATGTIVEHPKP
jgi:hypothetical protein